MARSAAKIAISVDRDLLDRAEHLRKETGETRSALLARALRQLVRSDARSRRIAAYVAGYRRHPESPAEVVRARKLARKAIAAVDWDDS